MLAKREPSARALLTDVPAPDRNTLPLAGHPIAAPGDAGQAWGYRGPLRPASAASSTSSRQQSARTCSPQQGMIQTNGIKL